MNDKYIVFGQVVNANVGWEPSNDIFDNMNPDCWVWSLCMDLSIHPLRTLTVTLSEGGGLPAKAWIVPIAMTAPDDWAEDMTDPLRGLVSSMNSFADEIAKLGIAVRVPSLHRVVLAGQELMDAIEYGPAGVNKAAMFLRG